MRDDERPPSEVMPALLRPGGLQELAEAPGRSITGQPSTRRKPAIAAPLLRRRRVGRKCRAGEWLLAVPRLHDPNVQKVADPTGPCRWRRCRRGISRRRLVTHRGRSKRQSLPRSSIFWPFIGVTMLRVEVAGRRPARRRRSGGSAARRSKRRWPRVHPRVADAPKKPWARPTIRIVDGEVESGAQINTIETAFYYLLHNVLTPAVTLEGVAAAPEGAGATLA